jgi:hypothetical protein
MKSKLEQSLKALQENDKKVEALLAAHRRDLADGLGGIIRDKEPEPKLEDPDEYPEWSGSEGLDEDDDDGDDAFAEYSKEYEYISGMLSESGEDTDSEDDLEVDKADSPSLLPEPEDESERDQFEGNKAAEK